MSRQLVAVALAWMCIFAVWAVGCQPAPTRSAPEDSGADQRGVAAGDTERAAASQRGQGRRSRGADRDGPVAYVHGEPVDRDDLIAPLMEAAGGQVLAELVLDHRIAERLEQRGVTLSEADLDAERGRVRDALAEEEDEAARLLTQLRRQRGLGERRFEQFLRRNAGLRKLVAEDVSVDEDAVRQAYRLEYGQRYRVRIIVVERFEEASRLRRKVIEHGASFGDLAARHSVDASADRGGLLSPISPDDASYPQSIREVLPELARRAERAAEADDEGARAGATARLSDVIALEGQFALVWLEEKIEPEPIEFADVRQELEIDVRRRLERGYMRQLARELLGEANVTVLDPVLSESWSQQRDVMLTP